MALVRCNCTGQSTRRLVKCACALSVDVATVTMEPSAMILLFHCTSARHTRRLAPSRRQQNALLQSRRRVETFRARQARHRQLFLMLLSAALIVSSQVDRRIWKIDRSGYWWQHIAKKTFSESGCLENFRMNRATFDYLCHQLAPMIERQPRAFGSLKICRDLGLGL